MQHVDTPLCNLTYAGDGQTVGDLRCRREQPGQIVSWWRPSRDELALLNAGGLVRLDLHCEPIPPVAVNVDPDPDQDQDLAVLGLALPVRDGASLASITALAVDRIREVWEQRERARAAR
jgi:hypothetical protein